MMSRLFETHIYVYFTFFIYSPLWVIRHCASRVHFFCKIPKSSLEALVLACDCPYDIPPWKGMLCCWWGFSNMPSNLMEASDACGAGGGWNIGIPGY